MRTYVEKLCMHYTEKSSIKDIECLHHKAMEDFEGAGYLKAFKYCILWTCVKIS